jgi:hypothetical protein
VIQISPCTRFDGGCNACDSSLGQVYKIEVGVSSGNLVMQVRLCHACFAELRVKIVKASR